MLVYIYIYIYTHTYVTGFGKIGLTRHLIYSTNRLHGALGCCPPNLEAVAQAAFALSTTTLQYLKKNNLLLLISRRKKTLRKGVAKVRGRALCPYTITACLRDTME